MNAPMAFWAQCLLRSLYGSSVLLLSLSVTLLKAAEAAPPPSHPNQSPPFTRLQRLGVQIPPLPSLPGADLYLPEAELLPTHVVLRLGQRRVYVYSDAVELASYPVAIGRSNTPTPTGEFQIFEMIENPIWQSPWTGAVQEPGPDSALGLRWIGFARMPNGVIGFHGTPTVSSIGRAASNGCVRLRNEHVLELFAQVQVGMLVIVEP